jgi:hypothetical protein
MYFEQKGAEKEWIILSMKAAMLSLIQVLMTCLLALGAKGSDHKTQMFVSFVTNHDSREMQAFIGFVKQQDFPKCNKL